MDDLDIGTGRPAFRADVALDGGVITAVGRLDRVNGRYEIDAINKVVCPGFIDTHTHSDLWPLYDRQHAGALHQGITTEVLGQDGMSYAPLSKRNLRMYYQYLSGVNGAPPVALTWSSVEEYRRIFDGTVAINTAYQVPHGALRLETVGFRDVPLNGDALKQAKRMLRVGIKEGAVEGGYDAVLQRLRTPELRKELCRGIEENTQSIGGVFSYLPSGKNDELLGKTFQQAAEERGRSPSEVLLDLLLDENLAVGIWGVPSASEEVTVQLDNDFLELLNRPYYMVGSDAIFLGPNPHPRAFGTFPKLLRLCREHRFPLETMINRMAKLPAQTFRLDDRGEIAEGKAADIVVFDPERVGDTATLEVSRSAPVGIMHVWVNGVHSVCDEKVTGAFGGRAVPRMRCLHDTVQSEGGVHLIHIGMYQHGPRRISERINAYYLLTDSCCHIIDTMVYLNGPIEAVHAMGARRNSAIVSDVTVNVRFSNGSLGSFEHSFVGASKGQHPFHILDVTTEKAWHVLHNLYGGLFTFAHDEEQVVAATPSVFEDRSYDDSIIRSVHSWIDRVERNEEPETGLEVSLHNLDIVSACIDSIETGRVVHTAGAAGNGKVE